MRTASTDAQNLMRNTNNAAEAQKALNQTSALASTGLKALASLGNMFAAWAISAVISAVIKGLDNLANSAKYCEQRVDELMSTYRNQLAEANSNAKTAENLAAVYEKLSPHVNGLGENLSLTSDQMKEYNDTVNQIAEMFPELVTGWTEEGNAILSLKGNVDGLRDSYQEAQKEAYNLLITSGKDADGDDILENWNNQNSTSLWGEIVGFVGKSKIGRNVSKAEAIHGLDTIINESYEDFIKRMYIPYASGIEKLSEDFMAYIGEEYSLNTFVTEEDFEKLRPKLKAQLQTLQKEMDDALSNVQSLATAYLMTNSDYDKLDEQSKNAASIIVSSINGQIASGFKEDLDVGAYVNNIVQMISTNSKAKDAIVGLFTFDYSDMPIQQAKGIIDTYIDYIAELLNEDSMELKIRLGFQDVDTTAYNYERVTQMGAKKFSGISIEEVNSGVKALKYDKYYDQINDFAVKNSINTQDEIAYWNECLEEASTLKEAMNKYLESDFAVPEFDLSSLKELESSLSNIESAYSTITSAIEEYNNQGYLSMNTVDSLIGLDDAYINKLIDANGNLQLNEDLLMETAKYKIEEAKASLYQAAQTEFLRITTLGANEAQAEYNLTLGQGTEEAYNQAHEAYMNAVNLGGANKLLADQVWNATQKRAAIYDKQMRDLEAGTYKFSSAVDSASDSAADSAASGTKSLTDIFTTEYNLLKHNLEMEYISEKDYYDQLTALNEQYYGGKEDYLDDYRKYEEEIYKGLKSYYKSYVDSQTDLMKKQLEAGRISYQQYTSSVTSLIQKMYSEGKISAEDYYSYEQQFLETQKSMYDKALSAVLNRIDQEKNHWQDLINDLEQQNDSLEKQKDTYDSILDVVDDVYQKEIDAQKAKQQAIDDQITSLQKSNEEEKEAISLANAKYNLERARTNRTRLVYDSENRQYIYKTDTDAVQSAGQELKDLELNQKISALEAEKDTINSTIEDLEKYRQLWNDITTTHDTNIKQQLAIDLWGQEYEQLILSNRMEDITTFSENYLGIQSQIDDNTAMIESYETKVSYYDSLKEKWNEISSSYEEGYNQQIAAMILGQGWEQTILDERTGTLEKFRQDYTILQQAIADAAWQSTNEQIRAAEEAKKGVEGQMGAASTISPGTGITNNNEKPKQYSVVSKVNGQMFETGFASEAEAKEWIRKNKGFNNMEVVSYHNGLLGNYSNSSPILQSTIKQVGTRRLSPDEFLAVLQKKELVINPSQQKTLLNNISNLGSSLLMQQLPASPRPSAIGPLGMSSAEPPTFIFNMGGVTLQGVQNVNDFGEEIGRRFKNVMYQNLRSMKYR